MFMNWLLGLVEMIGEQIIDSATDGGLSKSCRALANMANEYCDKAEAEGKDVSEMRKEANRIKSRAEENLERYRRKQQKGEY